MSEEHTCSKPDCWACKHEVREVDELATLIRDYLKATTFTGPPAYFGGPPTSIGASPVDMARVILDAGYSR